MSMQAYIELKTFCRYIATSTFTRLTQEGRHLDKYSKSLSVCFYFIDISLQK